MNRIERINLSKLKRCDQEWDQMEPNDCGRLCVQCNKTIIDFREMSNREVAEAHTFSDEAVCGVYREDQLGIPRQPKKKTSLHNFKSLYLVTLGLFIQNVADAQMPNAKPSQVQLDTIPDTEGFIQEESLSAAPQAISDSLLYYGTVKDQMGESIVFANVYVKGTKIGTTTDFDGRFQLDLSQVLDTANQCEIIISSLGYMRQTIIIEKPQEMTALNQSIIVEKVLEREIKTVLQTNTVTSFGVTVSNPPRYKRWWYKITSPFRK